MPFVNADHRTNPDEKIAGDRCFIQYREMKRVWNENPRWSTVDTIASWIWPNDKHRAQILAFLVFFAMVVLDYERLQKEKNGDI